MNRVFLKQMFTTFLMSMIVFAGASAFAGQASPAVPTAAFAGMSHAAWGWFLFGTAALVYAAQWVDPANTNTPGNWTGRSRALAFFVLGSLTGLAHLVTKDPTVPWTESLVTGLLTIVVPGVLHFSTSFGKWSRPASGGVAGAAVLCVAMGLGAGSSGCGQLIASNPAVYVSDFETAASLVNTGAQALFPVVLAQLPASEQATAQADFTKAEATYQSAITAINAGLAAYQDGTSQNWSALIASVTQAVDAVIAIIDQYGGSVPSVGAVQAAQGNPAYVGARARLVEPIATVHRYH